MRIIAKTQASAVIDAPIEVVWPVVRDVNGLPNCHPVIVRSEIEGGSAADMVGCVRSLTLADGTPVRDGLLSLDDTARRLTYNLGVW